MRIKKIKFLTIIFLGIGFLYAQLADGFLDREILDVELGENLIILGSKSGINFKYGGGDKWESVLQIPFGANSLANWDNIIAGKSGNFAVRLNVKNSNTISFYDRESGKVTDSIIPNANSQTRLFGYDGGFYDTTDNKYYFSAGDAGIVVLNNGKMEIINTKFTVNSISKDFKDNKFIAISDSGIIYNSNSEPIDTLKLNEEKEEKAIMFFKDFTDTSVLIMTFDKNDSTKLYRWNERKTSLIYNGYASKAATMSIPDKFIYILEDSVIVLNENGSPNENRRKEIEKKLTDTKVTLQYTLTDIAVRKNSLALATDKGVFYMENEENGFIFFPRDVSIKSNLKEIYAEPGILTAKDNFCTFEYSLEKNDVVTIDIFNYNMDFVCRIVENEHRPGATGDNRSTDRLRDRWDATTNNRGGKTVTPGVYFFRITTQNGKYSVGKIVVAK